MLSELERLRQQTPSAAPAIELHARLMEVRPVLLYPSYPPISCVCVSVVQEEGRRVRVQELEAQNAALLQQAGQLTILRESSQAMGGENARLTAVRGPGFNTCSLHSSLSVSVCVSVS